MNKIVKKIADFIRENCGNKTLENWLDENYLWPNTPWARVKLYAEFDLQQWKQSPLFFDVPQQRLNYEKVSEKKSLNKDDEEIRKIIINQQDINCYQRSKEIKNAISTALNDNKSLDESIKIVKYFISNWGGVSTNKDETIAGIIKTRENMCGVKDEYYKFKQDDKCVFRFSLTSKSKHINMGSVSSWSKYLSVAYPEWAHIYDSRVAYALNSFIYIYDLYESKLWPIPDGKNSKMNLLDIETLILSTQVLDRNLLDDINKITSERNGVSNFRKKYYLDDDKCYTTYLTLLERVKINLNNGASPINTNEGEIESFLFMVADGVLFDEVIKKSTSV